MRQGRLAQLGEHQLDKLGVTGSSPVPPTHHEIPKMGGFVVKARPAATVGHSPARTRRAPSSAQRRLGSTISSFVESLEGRRWCERTTRRQRLGRPAARTTHHRSGQWSRRAGEGTCPRAPPSSDVARPGWDIHGSHRSRHLNDTHRRCVPCAAQDALRPLVKIHLSEIELAAVSARRRIASAASRHCLGCSDRSCAPMSAGAASVRRVFFGWLATAK